MYFALRLLPIAVLLLLAACGSDEEQTDPCHGITCPVGFDCRAGTCVEREPAPEPAGCEVNSDCPSSAAPFCDRGSGACVACLDDDHCRGRSCIAGACVGSVCSSDEECGGDTPFCNQAGDACVACREAGDCAAGEACDAGACVPLPVECQTDAECAEAAPSRPLCQATDGRGLCVECRRSSDCADGVDCIGGSCVDLSCTSDDDCAGFPGRSRCGSGGRCVGCEGDGDCGDGARCSDEGLCEAERLCEVDADCAGDPGGPVCDPGTGACVACVVDGDCPFGQRCVDRSACVAIECTGSADCPLGARCDDGACVDPGACTGAGDCTFDPRAPQCGAAGRCVECTVDAHCGAGERCIGEVCTVPQECSSDAQCTGGFVCSGGLCGACRTDDQCPRGICSAGACVDAPSCASDRDCASGVCAGGVCAACATTLDCPAGLWCESGACVPPACTSTAACGAGSECVAGVCTQPVCEGVEEPNEHPVAARPFTPGAPLSRTLCPNDTDWFVFSAGQGATLNANLLAPPPGATLTLGWFDPDTGALKTQGAVGGRLLVPRLERAAQGRYYLRVQAAGAGGDYGLLATVSSGATSCTDVLEPNDDRNSPRPVPAHGWIEGLMLCGDDDFLLVDVPAGAMLRAYSFVPGGADHGFEVFTTAGQRIASSNPHAYLGGGRFAAVIPEAADRSVLIKISRPAPVELRYSVYLTLDTDPGCSAAPPLFPAGSDRVRLADSTLGRVANLDAGACGAGGPDLVYRVEVPVARRFVAQVRGPFPARLSLRSASCAGAELACAAAPIAEGTGTLDVPSLQAGSYTLVVGGAPDTAGPFELAAQLLPEIPSPVNDACGDAEAIALGASGGMASGTTRGAIRDGNLTCAPGAPEVYYEFTLASAARVVVDLQANGPASLALLGPGDCTTQAACAPPATRTRLDEYLTAGTWRLAVASASGAPVDFSLQVHLPQPVAGDACPDAQVIDVGTLVQGDNTWAENDSFFPLHTSCTGYYTGGPDVFHVAVLAAGQTVTATLTPAAGYDAALYVVDECAAPRCLAGADGALEGGVETLQFTAPATGIYYFVVDGSGGGGAYTLRLEQGGDDSPR